MQPLRLTIFALTLIEHTAARMYMLRCTDGSSTDEQCMIGQLNGGCRCDHTGLYTCDPPSLRRSKCSRCSCWPT